MSNVMVAPLFKLFTLYRHIACLLRVQYNNTTLEYNFTYAMLGSKLGLYKNNLIELK